MLVKVLERLMIAVVALGNGILMALIAKTHGPTRLLHVGSSLVSVTSAHMALFLHIVWILLSGVWLESNLFISRLSSSFSLLKSFSFFPLCLLLTPSVFALCWVHRTTLIYCCFHQALMSGEKKKKRRLETSISLLGPHSHKCLQGCLCWSLFC